jgi:hypothetical protein
MSRKLKNPLKYIKSLKGKVKWLEGSRDRLFSESVRLRGSHWFRCSPPHSIAFGPSKTLSVDGLKTGQEIIMVGKIMEIHQTLEGNSVQMEFGEFRTRKGEAT